MIETLLSQRPSPPAWLALDAGHDCAIVDRDLALTVDTLLEGVHFDGAISPSDLGYKAVAVSISDLAAARALPRWMLLSLSLPQAIAADLAFLDGLARGVREASYRYGIHLVGGDTTRSREAVAISVSVGGRLLGAKRSRSGARPGDDLWVTGWPGLAAVGYLDAAAPREALSALHHPDPPLLFALALDVASAAMDLSDGLASDLPRLCAASGVGISLDASALPVHPAIAASPALERAMLGGGDDYELLFTASPSDAARVLSLAKEHGVKVTRIGSVGGPVGARLLQGDWPKPAFAHFLAPEGARDGAP